MLHNEFDKHLITLWQFSLVQTIRAIIFVIFFFLPKMYCSSFFIRLQPNQFDCIIIQPHTHTSFYNQMQFLFHLRWVVHCGPVAANMCVHRATSTQARCTSEQLNRSNRKCVRNSAKHAMVFSGEGHSRWGLASQLWPLWNWCKRWSRGTNVRMDCIHMYECLSFHGRLSSTTTHQSLPVYIRCCMQKHCLLKKINKTFSELSLRGFIYILLCTNENANLSMQLWQYWIGVGVYVSGRCFVSRFWLHFRRFHTQ